MKEKDIEFITLLMTLLKNHKRSLKMKILGGEPFFISGDLILGKKQLTYNKLKKLIENDKST
jgi:hypothetical protein